MTAGTMIGAVPNFLFRGCPWGRPFLILSRIPDRDQLAMPLTRRCLALRLAQIALCALPGFGLRGSCGFADGEIKAQAVEIPA